MALQLESLAGLIADTLPTFDSGATQWYDVAAPISKFVALPRLLNQKATKVTTSMLYQWQLLTSYGTTAQQHGLYNTPTFNSSDHIAAAQCPIRHANYTVSYDEREMVANRADGAAILDHIRQKEEAERGYFAVLKEQQFWGKPTSSSDTTSDWGVGYSITYNATEGQTGTVPSGFTTRYGIDPATVTGVKNFSYTYVDISETDFLADFNTFRINADWESPIAGADANTQQLAGYTTKAQYLLLERMARHQNNNLGGELAMFNGKVVLAGYPIDYVPYLDSAFPTAQPFYFIDWRFFGAAVLSGYNMKRTVMDKSEQPHCTRVDYTLSMNWFNKIPKRMAVIAKSDPANG